MASRSENGADSARKVPASVWIAVLGLGALPALLLAFRRHGRYSLYYAAAGKVGKALAWLLRASGVLASPARPVELTEHAQRVDDPESPRLLIQSWIPNEFTVRFFEAHCRVLESLDYPDARVRADRVSTNLRKVMGESIHQLLDLAEFARYWHRKQGVPLGRLVVVSPHATLANALHPGWAGAGVQFLHPWSRRNSLLLRVARAFLTCLAASARPRRSRRDEPPSIAAEAAWGLDRTAKTNDLFWWWDSGIPARRVVLYFDRADSPADGEIVSQAQDLGIRCVVLRPEATGDAPHLLWRAAPGAAVALRRLWHAVRVCGWGLRRGLVGRWVACRALDMLHHSEHLEDFLTEFNVRALFHYQETDLDYPSLACDAAGAARVGVHWSYFPWPEVSVARLHQVYFAWGPQYARMLDHLDSCVDHVLLSGCIVQGAHRGGESSPAAQSERAEIASHGATRFLALLDTSLPCEGFYEFFLRRVLEDPRWGLLLKPKTRENRLPWVRYRLAELQSLYQQAIATGRVRMLDSRLSPAEAAAAADFSIGVDVQTATLVAALAGHRAIHLDYLRLHESPLAEWAAFYHAGPDRLVFDDPERLWRSLNRYFDQPGQEAALGVVDDALLRDLDAFQDGRAGQRIGAYLAWYLEALDGGLARDPALSEATRRYAERWGADKAVRGLGAATRTPVDVAAG